MTNTLTYKLMMQDGMSPVLKKIGAATEQTTSDVKDLEKETDELNKINLSGFLSSITKVAGVLGVGALIGKTIKQGMEQEARNTSFEVLFGGVDNAKKMIDDISSYASKTPYGKEELSEATQVMAGFGIAQEKIMPNLKAIGDIAMGDKNKLSSLTLAFSQMSSTGKLTGQDLMQMINAGFNPLNQMSQTTGKSIATLKDEMAKGAITSQMVVRAFHDATSAGGLYYGMTEKISNTTSGQWSTAVDNMNEKLLKLYNNVLQPVLLPALKLFNQFLENPIETISKLTQKVTDSFPVISTAIIGITVAILAYNVAVNATAIIMGVVTTATKAWAAAQAVLNIILSLNPIGLIIAGIAALIAIITLVIIKVNGWGDAWSHTINGMKLIFQENIEHIKLTFNSMVNYLMIGINKIKEGWYKFKEAVGLGDSSENKRMLDQISKDTEQRKNEIIEGQKKVEELRKQAFSEFTQAGQSLIWNKNTKKGIENVGIPGMATNNTGFVKDTDGATKETANSIATGGTKVTHITINLKDLVGTINIARENLKESAQEIQDVVLDTLTRVLTMAQGQAV